MKKLLCLTLLSLIGVLAYGQQTFNQKYFKAGMYFFDDIQKYTRGSLFTTHKQEFGLGINDSLALTYSVTDSNGKFDCKYEQYHKGVRVEGGAMFVHGDKGVALCANGRLIKNLNINTTITIAESDARQTAINFIGATQYIWEDSLREATLKEEEDDTSATHFPSGELIIVKSRLDSLTDSPSNFRRCYKFTIVALDPQSTTDVYIDAIGDTVFTSQSNEREESSHSGTGWTWYYGSFSNLKTARRSVGTRYYLKDIDRNIETRGRGGPYFYDDDNDWVSTDDKKGASAHWAMARAWDYYKTRFSRAGSDFSNRRIKVVANHLFTGLTNASWGFGRGNDYIKIRDNRSTGPISAAALDIIGHELTHGMLNATSELGKNETDFDAASLNEAFSDIMGVCVEGKTLGSFDWVMGEYSGTYERKFDNPRMDIGMHTLSGVSPDTYLGVDWLSVADEGMYSNTGVWRKWFYLTVNGGTHNFIGVPGMGVTHSEGLAYLSSNWWFWSNLKHSEAAKQVENAVVYYTRQCSNDHITVARALRAVGFTNIAIPACMKVVIKGDKVIKQSDANLNPRIFVAETNELTTGGTFIWDIPSGWTAAPQGNTLTVTNFSGFDSKKVSVTYTSPTLEVSSDTMVVHFSNESWVPEFAEAGQFYKTIEQERTIESKIAVFPNPAKNEVTIQLGALDANANLTITDIGGRIVRTSSLKEQFNVVDLRGLSSGLYIMHVMHKGTVNVQKLSILP